jgi:hypothetical protein
LDLRSGGTGTGAADTDTDAVHFAAARAHPDRTSANGSLRLLEAPLATRVRDTTYG